jgi:glycosyltransferase involved in cell wall biosynthesis
LGFKRKNILFLTSWWPTEKSPHLGNFIFSQAEALSKNNSLLVVVFEPIDSFNKTQITIQDIGGFQLLKIPYSSKRFAYFNKRFLSNKCLKFIKSLEFEPDIIHANVSHPLHWFFIKCKKEFKCPMLLTEHGSYLFEQNFKKLSSFHQRGIRKLYSHTDQIITVSKKLEKEIKKIDYHKTDSIGNFIPDHWSTISPIQSKREKYTFLHVSTLDVNKNVEGILLAAQKLKQSNLSFHLIIATDESYSDLEIKVNQLEISDSVEFVGPLSHSAMTELYSKADCFVLNSNIETFSIVAIEALFFGLHLISTDVGVVSELPLKIKSINSSKSAEELTELMKSAINDNRFGGIEAQNSVKNYSEMDFIKQYQNIYQSTLNNNA